MIRVLSILAALVVLAPSGQALVLLDPDPSEATPRVLVEQPPLRAQALEANASLDGTDLGSQPRNVSVQLEAWRGFENTTRIGLDGTGAVLVADGVSGIVLDPPDPPAPNGTEPDANGSTSREASSNATTPPPQDGANRTVEHETPSESSSPAPSDEERPTAASQEQDRSGDEQGGRDWPTPALLLGLVAAGAIGVEAWQRVAGDADDR